MDIQEALKNLQNSKTTGEVVVSVNGGTEVKFKKVHLHDFGEEKGGYIAGYTDTTSLIAFGYPGTVKDGPNSAKYKNDFQEPYMTWMLTDASGKNYYAQEGTLKITFSKHLQIAEGTFDFITDNHDKVSGTFSVTNINSA